MTRPSVVLGSVLVAATLLGVAAPCSAAVSISGTVKVTGAEAFLNGNPTPHNGFSPDNEKSVTVDAAKPATVELILAR